MSRAAPYRVVVAEDEPLILNNICTKIEREDSRFAVVGRSLNGQQAWESIRQLQPDVLFTDIRMPIMGGLELIRLVAERYPAMQIVVVSGYDEFAYAQQAIQCGAKGYLLKPVEAEEMKAMLGRLHAERQTRSGGQERELLAAALQNGRYEPDSLGRFEGRSFRLALVHLGHLAGPLATSGQAAFYERLWERGRSAALDAWPWPQPDGGVLPIASRSFGQFLLAECEEPGAADEGAAAASSGSGAEEELARWVQEVQRAVLPYPATVAVCGAAVAYRELYERAQALMRAIERGAVPGRSQLLRLGHGGSDGGSGGGSGGGGGGGGGGPAASPWLKPSEQTKLGTLLQSGKKAVFRKELIELFRQWEAEGCPQRIVEKRLAHLLQLTRQHSLLLNEDEASHLEHEMLYQLGEACRLSDIAEGLADLLDSAAFIEEDRDQRDTSELAGHVEQYLRANFARTITLTDVSDQFAFSPSYITKLFKQHYGVGPLKYLISLRMDEAKRLIARHPELSFKDVGVAVGYEDPNYFSRIFKNTTGCSLTDFSRQCRGLAPGDE